MGHRLWLKGDGQGNSTAVKLLWLISSLWGFWLVALPAEAAKLQFWRFDLNRNRLEFTTDTGVQPQAQLIANPTRLVIDLPGIILGRPPITQNLGQAIQTVRVAQFDRQTTRIVVELAPGYTLNPEEVQVRGTSPTTWSVQLPQPIPIAAPEGEEPAADRPVDPPAPIAAVEGSKTQLNDIRVTPDGLFIGFQGRPPKVKVKRSRDRRQITLELRDTAFSNRFSRQTYALNHHGITQLQIEPAETDRAIARLTLNIPPESPDWFVSVSNFGGIVLLPQGGATARATPNRPERSFSLLSEAGNPSHSPQTSLATIEGVDLGGSQLLIRADKPLTFTTAWEGATYKITLRSAQLAEQVQGPRLGPGSPLTQVRLRQEDPQTVTILATPAPGVRIQAASRFNPQAIVVQLVRPGAATAATPPVLNPTPAPLPTPSGRAIVVIDPGHGGPDVGAVGIGGLRETNVVLDISLEVSRLLQQQGVIVYLTRTDERDVDLPPRVALAERVKANVFVSIHANAISLSRPDVNGVETYHAPGAVGGARLARAIHNSILQSLNVRDRGVRSARFYVVRNASMPSVLVETGFVTGAEDARNLANPSWRKQMAAAIARGVLQFLKNGG